jgi:hypothetical protein
MLKNTLLRPAMARPGGAAQARLELAEELISHAFALLALEGCGAARSAEQLHHIVTAIKLREELSEALGKRRPS